MSKTKIEVTDNYIVQDGIRLHGYRSYQLPKPPYSVRDRKRFQEGINDDLPKSREILIDTIDENGLVEIVFDEFRRKVKEEDRVYEEKREIFV